MKKSACFTGHRKIAGNEQELSNRLYAILEKIISGQRLTDFYTGGAVGFDTIAALNVLKIRESYPQIKLHLVLPCPFEEQTENWTTKQKTEFEHITSLADTVEYTSQHYHNSCMKVRNIRLVECASEFCICYWNENRHRSGTGQTVRMALKKGLRIINLFE